MSATLPRTAIMSLAFKDHSQLHAAYMPFLRNGGLFVPTARTCRLGDEVFVLLSLPGEPERIPLSGKVAWITPPGAQGNRVAGIGVQFGEGDQVLRKRIETSLAGTHPSERPTLTL